MDRPHTAQGDPDAQRRHGATEPWLTVLPVPAYLRLVAEAGWIPESQADPRQGSASEGRSLFVVARRATLQLPSGR
jgi:hypothetical protein